MTGPPKTALGKYPLLLPIVVTCKREDDAAAGRPEAFDAVPFLDLLAAPKPHGYGSPWGMEER